MPVTGGYMANFNHGGMNHSSPPLPYAAEFATPNALTAMAGTTLNLHNSVMVLEDTHPPPASNPVVAGSPGGNVARQAFLSALSSLGLITNSTT